MDADPNPAHDPFNLQESRKDRGERRARSHRHTTVGVVIALVVLAAVGLGAYFLMTKDHSATAASTTSTSLVGSSSTTPSSESSTTMVPSTTSTLANLAPQQLKVSANPEAVKLIVTLQDGTTLTGKTPFLQKVPGGHVKIELSKPGYNTAARDLTLDRPTDLKVWLDPQGQVLQSLVRFKSGRGPQQVAFSPDGRELWVSLLNGAGLEVYSSASGKKTGEVTLGGKGAAELIFTNDGQTIYASQIATGLVYEIDRVSRTVKRQFKTEGKSPKVLLLSADEKTLWTANWDSSDISQIDLTTGALVRRLPTVAKPRGLYATPDGASLYVAGFATGEVQRIDLGTSAGKVIFKTGGAMWDLAADEARGLLYVDDTEGNAVYVIDLEKEAATKLAGTDHRPNTLDLSADGKVLYVSNRGKEDPANASHAGPEWGSVLAIDTSDGAILDAIVGGNQCTGLDVSSDGSLLAFSDFLDDHVRMYSIPTYSTLIAGNGGRAAQRLKDIAKH
jgi:DNA-binding beta-propeller fold protein YncE